MAINYSVLADIVDINNDTPRDTDTFFVDTNIWFWLTYTRASISGKYYQINSYPAYIKNALNSKLTLIQNTLSLAELAYIIERTEFNIYATANKFNKSRKKEFRHNFPAERAGVVTEITTAWNQVKTMGVPMDVKIDERNSNSIIARLGTQLMDGYDLFNIEIASKANVKQIITDDGDFVSVPGLQVFTSNPVVINAAKQQCKLMVR